MDVTGIGRNAEMVHRWKRSGSKKIHSLQPQYVDNGSVVFK